MKIPLKWPGEITLTLSLSWGGGDHEPKDLDAWVDPSNPEPSSRHEMDGRRGVIGFGPDEDRRRAR